MKLIAGILLTLLSVAASANDDIDLCQNFKDMINVILIDIANLEQEKEMHQGDIGAERARQDEIMQQIEASNHDQSELGRIYRTGLMNDYNEIQDNISDLQEEIELINIDIGIERDNLETQQVALDWCREMNYPSTPDIEPQEQSPPDEVINGGGNSGESCRLVRFHDTSDPNHHRTTFIYVCS